MTYSIQLDTAYGPFLMNRHDLHQPMAIVRTGVPHIHNEIQQLLAVANLLPEGAVAIDAGANIGLISIPLARQLAARGGTVISFEPQRLIYYMLCGNVVLAGLENLICHQVALGSEVGTITVPRLNPHLEQDFGMVSLENGAHQGDIVNATMIDMLQLGRLDFMKIDVEHMELAVLNGGRETIEKFQPLIWIEVWPQHYQSIYNWFAERDYVMLIVDSLNFCAIPKSKVENFPLSLQVFDGANNPHFEAIHG